MRLIGGCCGTTPQHIAYIKSSVKDLKPVKNKNVIPINRQTNRAVTHTYKHNLTTKVKNRPTVIVELDTPKHLDTDLFFENIGKLDEANIDAVTSLTIHLLLFVLAISLQRASYANVITLNPSCILHVEIVI